MRGGSAQLAAPIDPADGLSLVQGLLATSFWESRRRGPASRNVLATNSWMRDRWASQAHRPDRGQRFLPLNRPDRAPDRSLQRLPNLSDRLRLARWQQAEMQEQLRIQRPPA